MAPESTESTEPTETPTEEGKGDAGEESSLGGDPAAETEPNVGEAISTDAPEAEASQGED